MRDGQSFAISGMLTDEMSNVVRAVPVLGSLPILGVLFKSKAFERQETELIVVVTARLVDPLEAEDMPPLPGEDMLTDPNDLQLFLLNVDETSKKKAVRKRKRRPRPTSRVGGLYTLGGKLDVHMHERDLNSKRALSGATAIVRLSDIESRLKELDEKEATGSSVMEPPEETVDIQPSLLEPVGLSSKLGVSTKAEVAGTNCKIFAFFGAKGGAGTTSLSINVGGTLCSLGYSVLLVDMDLQLGAAADSLGLSPQRSLAQLAQMLQDNVDVTDFPYAQHSSGLCLWTSQIWRN